MARKKKAAITVLALGVLGAVAILHVHHWQLDFSALILWLAWLSVLGTAVLLGNAAMVVTSQQSDEVAIREVTHGRHDELLREKRMLLKAIKEVEFDRDLGKMSPEDAGAIVREYRARAIEVIKELETETLPPSTLDERIERDVRAAMATASKGSSLRAATSVPAPMRRGKLYRHGAHNEPDTKTSLTRAQREAKERADRIAFADEMLADADDPTLDGEEEDGTL